MARKQICEDAWCGRLAFLGLGQIMVSDLANPSLVRGREAWSCQGRVQPELTTHQRWAFQDAADMMLFLS